MVQDAWEYELKAFVQGRKHVAGVDEAGMGCIAGPLVLAVVRFEARPELDGMRDGKQLTHTQREQYAERVRRLAADFAVASADSGEIDHYGIARAWRRCLRRALAQLKEPPDHLLIDGVRLLDEDRSQETIVAGDSRSLSVMAAGILAKVERDRIMAELDAQHPGWGLAEHKGYATPDHLAAIERLGACPIHRLSFAPFTKQMELF